MSRGKYLSFEEARARTNRLGQFAKEHPCESNGRFWPVLNSIIKGSPKGGRTSTQGNGEDYSGIQTPSRTSRGVSRKREHASHESATSHEPRTPRSRWHGWARSHTRQARGSRFHAEALPLTTTEVRSNHCSYSQISPKRTSSASTLAANVRAIVARTWAPPDQFSA